MRLVLNQHLQRRHQRADATSRRSDSLSTAVESSRTGAVARASLHHAPDRWSNQRCEDPVEASILLPLTNATAPLGPAYQISSISGSIDGTITSAGVGAMSSSVPSTSSSSARRDRDRQHPPGDAV
jgi:hypothetical protein